MKPLMAAIMAALCLGGCQSIGPRGDDSALRREVGAAPAGPPQTVPETRLARGESVARDAAAAETLRQRDAVLASPRAAAGADDGAEAFADDARERARPPERAD